jgi:DNA-directed RNA polymerase subunit RPC12/RpoP/exosome complex RNA-binding protein Csl4
MDIVFNCPHCDQELAVDNSGAGTEIQCPSCGEKIMIPAAATPPAPGGAAGVSHQSAGHSIASSAAAKIEMHLKVPVRDKPGEVLIAKPKPPLEVVTRGSGKKIHARTIRHSACVEAGHDKFDEKVTEFLDEIGEADLIAAHTVSYTHFDVGTQKILTDYGVLILYRG